MIVQCFIGLFEICSNLAMSLNRISGLVFNVCKDFTLLSVQHCINIPQMFWFRFVLKLFHSIIKFWG